MMNYEYCDGIKQCKTRLWLQSEDLAAGPPRDPGTLCASELRLLMAEAWRILEDSVAGRFEVSEVFHGDTNRIWGYSWDSSWNIFGTKWWYRGDT